MTREDAIHFLKGYLDEEVYTEKCRNAHEMAIKALEQEPILDKIRAEIQDIAFDSQEIDGEHESIMILELNDALNIIDKYKGESEDNA
jgi:hypothetical protein